MCDTEVLSLGLINKITPEKRIKNQRIGQIQDLKLRLKRGDPLKTVARLLVFSQELHSINMQRDFSFRS